MKKFQIVCDSACDLNSLDKANQVPFVVSFDGEKYFKEKEEISVSEFYEKLDGVYPKTSVPSVQDFIDKFRPILENDQEIICVTISSELSSSLQSAKNASVIMLEEYPKSKIYVIDSRLATVPYSLLVLEMLKMKNNGDNIEDVVAYLESAKHESGVYFTVGDVSYLQKGGRIGNVVLKSAKALNLKAIASLKDGKVASNGVARGEKSALSKIIQSTIEHFDNKNICDYVFSVGYTDMSTETLAYTLENEFKKVYPNAEFHDSIQIGATIGAHTGKGTFGIGFSKKR